MHLFILNPGSGVSPSPHPYRGAQSISDYSSLVWTERFRDYGEFQINIPRSALSATRFWPGTLLGIQESDQVMLVETQRERVNSQGYLELILTGRSAESIIEDRVLWAPQGTTFTLARQYNDLDAALLYLWGAVLNDTTNDVGYTVPRPTYISTGAKISDLILTDSLPSNSGFYHKINVNPGQMGPTIRQFLIDGGFGLRCVRPPSNVQDIYSVTVDPVNGPNKGMITRTRLAGTTTKLRFDVYAGVDRSIMPPTQDQAVFLSTEAGHLENVDVATTYREFVTSTVFGVDASTYYPAITSVAFDADFGVRQRFLDASSLVQGMTVAEHPPIISRAQQLYFQSHTNRAVLTADVAQDMPFAYGVDYGLGDTVMLRYKDRTRRVLVNEYTRVDDHEGSRAYPGFLAWDEIVVGGAVRDW